MKTAYKFLSILILVIVFSFGLFACGEGENPDKKPDTQTEYTIEFVINDTVEYTTTYKETDEDFNLSPFVKTGYTFSGWFNEDGDIVSVIKKGTKENMTLLGILTPISYSVEFNANGGSGEMAKMTFQYDVTKNLTANAFTKEDYTFAGWSKEVDGTVLYDDAASVKNLSTESGATVVLYAKWIKNEDAKNYTVHFDANGGAGTMDDMAFLCDVTKKLSANAFTREGYIFEGWALSADGEIIYNDEAEVINLTEEDGATVTLYAKWIKIKSYTVHFDANGGTGTMDDITVAFEETKNLTENTFTRDGYLFEGWALSADGEIIYENRAQVKDLSDVDGATVTLYAKWLKIKTYTIKFDANGGTGEMDDMTVKYGVTKTLTANSFTKVGYEFNGWSLTKDGSLDFEDKAAIKNLTDEDEATITLYARWIEAGAIELPTVPLK